MPYIKTTTSVNVTEEDKKILKERFASLIEIFPGKSEQWLMLAFNDGITMSFRGDIDTPCAIVEIDIFGSADSATYDKATKAVCDTVSEVIGVPPDRVYVKYRECDKWGYNGFNF